MGSSANVRKASWTEAESLRVEEAIVQGGAPGKDRTVQGSVNQIRETRIEWRGSPVVELEVRMQQFQGFRMLK